jgi:hypothetical protein
MNLSCIPLDSDRAADRTFQSRWSAKQGRCVSELSAAFTPLPRGAILVTAELAERQESPDDEAASRPRPCPILVAALTTYHS